MRLISRRFRWGVIRVYLIQVDSQYSDDDNVLTRSRGVIRVYLIEIDSQCSYDGNVFPGYGPNQISPLLGLAMSLNLLIPKSSQPVLSYV